MTELLILLPVTSIDRRRPNHVELRSDIGSLQGFAMTEQPRTASRACCAEVVGLLDTSCAEEIETCLGDFLGVG